MTDPTARFDQDAATPHRIAIATVHKLLDGRGLIRRGDTMSRAGIVDLALFMSRTYLCANSLGGPQAVYARRARLRASR